MLECVHITERGDKYVTSDLANGSFITLHQFVMSTIKLFE